MSRPPKYTKEDVHIVNEFRKKGESMQWACNKLDYCYDTIRKLAKKLGGVNIWHFPDDKN